LDLHGLLAGAIVSLLIGDVFLARQARLLPDHLLDCVVALARISAVLLLSSLNFFHPRLHLIFEPLQHHQAFFE